MANALVTKASRTVYKLGFKLRKHSPEILAVAGTIGVVGTVVTACKATTKAGAILEEAKSELDKIHAVAENPEYAEKYTEENKKKDLVIVYTQTAVKFIKLYGPSVALGIASLGCLLTSNQILRKRNIALAAAYTAIDKGFKQYRGRVIERFGEELDKELRYNLKAKEINETVVNEDGSEQTITGTVMATNPDDIGPYDKFFDEYCKGWVKNAEDNLYFVRSAQNWANDRLKDRGVLFLNEVYEQLGIEPTRAGQIVGWIYDEKNPTGENFVDFGIYDIYNEKARDFVNGRERSILLHFNVDGVIIDNL